MTLQTKAQIKALVAASTANNLLGGEILDNIVDSYGDSSTLNVIYASDYGVLADGVTDDSAAWALAIAAANAPGNTAIIAPEGTSLAPSLAATISGINVWIVSAGGVGASLLSLGTNNAITWTGYAGGVIGMGFQNTGANTNTTINLKAANQQFLDCVLGNNIGTFINYDTGASGALVRGLTNYNGGVGNANQALFGLNNGVGFEMTGCNLYTGVSAGTAAAGRALIFLSTGNFDTIRIHGNFAQEFARVVAATAPNGSTLSNLFATDNIWDGFNAGYDFTADAGGAWYRIDIQDKWISAVNQTAIFFHGAGTFDNINISTKIVSAGTSGIISTASGTFKNVKVANSVLTGLNVQNSGGTADGINLAGGAGYSNISIVGNSVGAVSQGGTQPKNGLSLGAAIDHLTVVGNDCQGTVANYQGMLVGTTTRYAHTNCVQLGNVGLANNSVTFSGDANNVITVTDAAGSANVLKISGNNAVDTNAPSIRSDASNLVLNARVSSVLYLNFDTAADLNINAAGGTTQFGSGCFNANGSVATALTSVGPTGSHTTVQEWLVLKNASGATRYIPCF